MTDVTSEQIDQQTEECFDNEESDTNVEKTMEMNVEKTMPTNRMQKVAITSKNYRKKRLNSS